MACETLQQKTTENRKLQDLQRQEGGGKYAWDISEQIQGTTTPNGAKVEGCQRHLFDMCCVAQHAEDKPKQTRQGTHPADDIAALQN